MPDAIIEQCLRTIGERRSARHPFVTHLERLRPTRRQLGAWAAQKYHQVYLQNTAFSAIHSNAPAHEDVRKFMMEQLIAEETPIASGSDAHYNLMRRFAAACGVGADAFARERCRPEVHRFVDTVRGLAREQHFVLGLLAIYAVEAQSGEGVARILNWLRAHHSFSETELEWFTVHSEVEDDHAQTGLILVRKYAGEVRDFAEAAPRAVETMCDAWLRLHDFYHSLLQAG